ncbi:MAG: FHA domain-containing protein [Clostridiales bacterium]|jgi:hypothetical protein|nr:FHA domain-containing protein [Clostridiales bacterium]
MKKYPAAFTVFIAVLLSVTLFNGPYLSVSAVGGGNQKISQMYISGRAVTVFTDGPLNAESVRLAVSNIPAEVTAAGSLSGPNALIKTTLLVDISTSMPRDARSVVIETLNELVENKAANEEFRLAIFGEELTVLTEFSSDRYDIAKGIDEVEFDGDWSIVYNAIQDTIPLLEPHDGKPVFYRTVVITDGVDDTARGITLEELLIELQDKFYPIDAVRVSEGGPESKELSSIVRLSGGRYFTLDPSSDPGGLAASLSVAGYSYLEAITPPNLMDGSVRQTDIADGSLELTADFKYPAVDSPIAQPPVTSAPEPADEEVIPEPEPVKERIPGGIFIAAGVVLVLAAAGILFIVILRRKKAGEPAEAAPEYYEDDDTILLHGDSEYGKGPFASRCSIELTNQKDPKKTWALSFQDELLIGRGEHCGLRLEDKTVSREQCKITAGDDGVVIIHLSKTNKTRLNGVTVTENVPVKIGDVIKCGRESLHIDNITLLNVPGPGSEHKSGLTELLFK